MYYGVWETEDAIQKMQSFQIPCCEVFLETFSEYDPAFGRLLRSRLGGMAPVSMHTRMQHFEADLLGQSPRQRSDAYKLFGQALDTGAALGVKHYVYHGPQAIRGKHWPIAAWGEDLAQIRAVAAERGIDFCWETVSWCALNTPDCVTEARSACPDMGFVLDVKQTLETGYDPFAFIQAMGPNLRHVHVLDRDADGRYVFPGRGRFDFPRLASILKTTGYAGDIILEPYSEMARDESALRASLAYLRELFEEA
jgi:sugar phosphate isomerase/epimerase